MVAKMLEFLMYRSNLDYGLRKSRLYCSIAPGEPAREIIILLPVSVFCAPLDFQISGLV